MVYGHNIRVSCAHIIWSLATSIWHYNMSTATYLEIFSEDMIFTGCIVIHHGVVPQMDCVS